MIVMLSALSTFGYFLRLVVNEEGLVVFRMTMCLQDQSIYGRENDKASNEAGHRVQVLQVATKNSLPIHG